MQHSQSQNLRSSSPDSLDKYNGKCVCKICTCNQKHRCPQRSYPLQTETTNNFYYKPHPVTAYSPTKREQIQLSPPKTPYEKDDLQTSYQKSYKKHDLSPNQRRPRTAKQEYRPSPFKFQGQTQYRNKYSPIKMQPQQRPIFSPKKRQYLPSPHKFQGSTTYNNAYSPKHAERTEVSPRRRKIQYSPSKLPLETQTTYGKFYRPHQVEAYQPSPESKKNRTYVPSPVKFQGQTRYREFYRPLATQPRERCPMQYLPRRPYRCSPGKDHTHYNSTMNSWE